jgi:hypothetical protein
MKHGQLFWQEECNQAADNFLLAKMRHRNQVAVIVAVNAGIIVHFYGWIAGITAEGVFCRNIINDY